MVTMVQACCKSPLFVTVCDEMCLLIQSNAYSRGTLSLSSVVSLTSRSRKANKLTTNRLKPILPPSRSFRQNPFGN